MTAPEIRIVQGHVIDKLRELPDRSVHCVVTSPPYWGLRDYSRCECAVVTITHPHGGPPAHNADEGGHLFKREPDPDCPKCHGTGKDESLTAVWDAKEGCEHEWKGNLTRLEWERKEYRFTSLNESAAADVGGKLASDLCEKCGAWRGQLGLEPTPGLYVNHIVQVFREVRRVLRDDGTLWLDMGDSYFGDSPVRMKGSEAFSETWDASQTRLRGGTRRSSASVDGLKPKDLVGMPWRVAFALQADGWWLRSDIVWAKPNPMPESVTDRPTKAHEYIFLMAKSRTYYYNADAIREPILSSPSDLRKMVERLDRIGGKSLTDTDPLHAGNRETNVGRKRAVGNPETARVLLARSGNKNRKFRADYGGVEDSRSHQAFGVPWEETPGLGRNARTVWTVPTQPYPEAHFATFPEALAERCIKTGTKAGDTVLDPFAGSGTLGAVARSLGRSAILIEIKEQYVALARQRARTDLSTLDEFGAEP